MVPEVPAALLQAVSAQGGGQLALVIGAGCSVEPPTNMPLASPIAREVERQLVLDGILQQGECPNPGDLAALSSLVFERTESQDAVVTRFPLRQMRLAKANAGYKLLVALMAERAVSYVLSLNFDLAVQNAASELGSDIEVIDRPDQLVPMRATVVHLHGNVNSPNEALVLREETINAAWRGQWQQVVAQQILSAPNILFAGLGSAAPVLTASVGMIADAIGGVRTIFQADLGAYEHNQFAAQLGIPAERYIQSGWSAILQRLGDRVASDQIHALRATGAAVLAENGASQEVIDRFAALSAQYQGLSLLAIGKLRAFAKLDMTRFYVPHSDQYDEMMAHPIVKLAELCTVLGFEAQPTPGGTWKLTRDGRLIATTVLASGWGVRKLEALEPRALHICGCIAEGATSGPDFVLIAGVLPSAALVDHIDIIQDDAGSDIIDGPGAPLVISANDLNFIERVGGLLNAA